MDYERQQELDTERTYLIVKSNDIVRKTRYMLTTTEQKLLLYLISKIKPTDTEFELHDLNLARLCDVLGIEHHRQAYKRFMDSIQALADKSFWIYPTPEKKILVRWIEKVEIFENRLVKIRLDSDLKPYLLELHDFTTRYALSNVLSLDSKYSIRMYELLKSYQSMNCIEISLEMLKTQLCCSEKGYQLFNNFKTKILEVAIAEINENTDINVTFEPIRESRKITALRFFISKKKGFVAGLNQKFDNDAAF